jgi:hypothetical protein
MFKARNIFIVAIAIISPGFAVVSLAGAAQPEGQALATHCGALLHHDFANLIDAPAQVTSAKVVVGAGDLPAFCEVEGYTAPNNSIAIRLPLQAWNGKFFFAGCGGSCGEIKTSLCDYPLLKGYACIVSDNGHRSSGGDGLWAYHNLSAQVDFGFRATHRATVAGKAITAAFYESPLRHAYFMGCSTGGRQAMVEAQSFPTDFDGIISGGTVISEAGTDMDFLWNLQHSIDATGNALFSLADLALINRAAVAAADAQDGVVDGILPDPRTNTFNPSSLICKAGQTNSCLSAVQGAAVAAIYSGPMTSAGVPTYHGGGQQRGSELAWAGFAPRNGKRAEEDVSGSDTGRYMLSNFGPKWTFKEFDFDRDPKLLAESDRLYAASNPDLRDFKTSGGKLIMYEGWIDPMVVPMNSVDYYETVEKTMGGRSATQSFYRLFMVPGMEHCIGGPGATVIDYVSALENWVENGVAPDRLLASHLDEHDTKRQVTEKFPLEPAKVTFTRPVYPYPIWAKYKGNGDSRDAANWGPVTPKIKK